MQLHGIEVPPDGTRWKHYNGNIYAVTFMTNITPEPDERYPATVVYQNVANLTRWSRRLDDWHRSMTLETPAPGPLAAATAKREAITVAMSKDALSLRPDLPTTFTFTPSPHQDDQCRRNTGKTLEELTLAGEKLTWAELAAILEIRPVSIMKELRAVMVCLRVAPQPGFVL